MQFCASGRPRVPSRSSWKKSDNETVFTASPSKSVKIKLMPAEPNPFQFSPTIQISETEAFGQLLKCMPRFFLINTQCGT